MATATQPRGGRQVRPHTGPQTAFLRCAADLAIYGGSSGSGKSFGLTYDDLAYVSNPNFHSITFRRTYKEIAEAGGLWDQARELYGPLGAKDAISRLTWTWPSGARSVFSHMQHEKDMFTYQGLSLPRPKFDELTHFTQEMFFYLFSRNRSKDPTIRPYIRATTQADAESWVATLLAWWIDQDTGFPIPERSGQIRWLVRHQGELLWADDPRTLPWFTTEVDGEMIVIPPRSVTFIPARIENNLTLLKNNPEYLGMLLALGPVERARQLEGNWKVRNQSGNIIHRDWWQEYTSVDRRQLRLVIQTWDTAFKDKQANSYSVCVTWGLDHLGNVYVLDVWRAKPQFPDLLRQAIAQYRAWHPLYVVLEDRASGQSLIQVLDQETEIPVIADKIGVQDKVERLSAVSSFVEARRVYLPRFAAWKEAWIEEHTAFPYGAYDDQVDNTSMGLRRLLIDTPQFPGPRTAIGPPRPAIIDYTAR